MVYKLTPEEEAMAREVGLQQFRESPAGRSFAKPKEKGNLFTNSLSTAGGILGGIGGSFFGPGIGTAAGGAAGSAAGKFLENLLEGNNATEGVGMEAAFGTLGGIGKGLKAVKGAAGALKTGGTRDALAILKGGPGANLRGSTADAKIKDILTTGAGSNRPDILRKLEQSNMTDAQRLAATGGDTGQAGLQMAPDARNALLASFRAKAAGATNDASKYSTGGKLKSMGNSSLLSQYGTISKPVARETNPVETIGKLADMGITKPADVERIASGFTGTNGIVNKALVKAVGRSGGVDTSTLRQVFDDALDNYGLVDKDRESLNKVFTAQMKRLHGGAAGSLDPKANPSEALSVMKAFEKRIANLQGKGGNYHMSTPERADQASVLKMVKDELQDRLYDGAGANANISKVITPKLREELLTLSPNNPKWASYIDNNVMSAKDIAQLRSSMAPFVKGSKIVSEGDVNALTFGGRMGNNVNGVKDMIAGAVTNLVKDPIARVAGKGLRAAGNITLPKNAILGGAARAAGPSAMGIAGMQLGGRALAGNLPGQMNGNMPGTAAMAVPEIDSTTGQPVDPMAAINSSTNTTDGLGGGFDATGALGGQSQSMYSRENAAADIQKDLATTGGANMDKYLKLYEFMNPENAASKANATTQKALAQSANADATLQQLQNMLDKAGGSGGPIGGNISSFLGRIGLNNDAKTYNDLASGSVTQIAKALGETGAMSDSDRIAYANLIPKMSDPPAVAAAKFAALRERMAVAKNSALTYGAGDGIEEALASGNY